MLAPPSRASAVNAARVTAMGATAATATASLVMRQLLRTTAQHKTAPTTQRPEQSHAPEQSSDTGIYAAIPRSYFSAHANAPIASLQPNLSQDSESTAASSTFAPQPEAQALTAPAPAVSAPAPAAQPQAVASVAPAATLLMKARKNNRHAQNSRLQLAASTAAANSGKRRPAMGKFRQRKSCSSTSSDCSRTPARAHPPRAPSACSHQQRAIGAGKTRRDLGSNPLPFDQEQ